MNVSYLIYLFKSLLIYEYEYYKHKGISLKY